MSALREFKNPLDSWQKIGTLYDSGTVTATVNGFGKSVTYGQTSTPTSLAAALRDAFNSDGASPVTASSSNGVLTVTSKVAGAASNYSLSTSSATAQTAYFSGTSFPSSRSGPTLTGGRDATYFDSGTVSITVNGVTKTVNYGQTSTPQSIASALASAFYNDPSAPATATASGATVNLTSRVAGQGTNYSLSSSRAYDTAHFSQPSFTTSNSGSTLTGASDVIYDSGSVSITADGLTKTASFGQNSTASGIATALASAFNGDASSTVDAVASGGTVTLTNKTTGAHAVYSASYSYNNGVFAQSSFTPALVNDYAMVRGEVFIGSAHFATYTNGHTYFHHTNWLGSESSRTDETGTKVQDCEWQSFGELKGCTGVQLDAITPYGYAGYERDSETGLDHMQFRYYNPRIGRFLSPDLLSGDTSSPQSFNKFGYAVGDPINRFDPTGLVDQCGRNCHDGEGSGPDWDDRMFNALARAFGGGGGGAGSGGGNCSINNLSVACPPGWSVRVRSIPVNVVVGCMYCGWDGNQLVKAGIWLTEPGWLQIPEWTFDPYAYSQAWGRQQRSKVKGMFPDEQITPEKAIAAIEASFAYIPMLCDPTFISISGKIGPFEGSSTYNTGTGSWTFSDKSQGGKWPPEIKANLKSLSINAGVTLAIPKTNLKASGGIKVQYTVTNYKDCAHP